MFIGQKKDPNEEFLKKYLEINISPKNQIFVNRIENFKGQGGEEMNHIPVEEHKA